MNKLYNVGFCMILSCSTFLYSVELRGIDAQKEELQSQESHIKERDFDVQWIKPYLNLKTVISKYVGNREMVHSGVTHLVLKDYYSEKHLLNTIPMAKGDLICAPLNFIAYVGGIKYLAPRYPLKPLLVEASITAAEDISTSVLNILVYKHLPRIMTMPANGSLKSGALTFLMQTALSQIVSYPADQIRKKIAEKQESN